LSAAAWPASVVDALRILHEQAPESIGELLRDLVRDKSYQSSAIGQHTAAYLRAKRKRLTELSFIDYESSLDKLARFFPDLELADLEPPAGTTLVEEFLDATWGSKAARTYNKNLSIAKDFFKWHVIRGNLHGDPTTPIEPARPGEVYRTTFTADQRKAIIASAADRRDRIALHLLLDYGIRKGALTAVRFKHFDHQRKRLTIFTKGQKVRDVPIPDPSFWMDLERLILDTEAQPAHFLMQRRKSNGAYATLDPTKPKGAHGMHDWWYRRLAAAGVVEPGTTSGEKMHKSRHTAGQRVLDTTGNLKAVQKLLGHKSIATTGDIYADWDIDQLNHTMESVLAADQTSPEGLGNWPDADIPTELSKDPANQHFMETVGIEPTSAIA
jgi:integrase/recombinase XerC